MVNITKLNFQMYSLYTELQYLLSGDRYEGKEDFAVVLQPFLQNSFIPLIGEGEADASFFSIDCFHISERAHAEMAIALWNNMLEPVGRKQAYNNFTYDRSKIHCPSKVFMKGLLCPSSISVWVPVVVGIASLVVGIVVAWLIMPFTRRQTIKEKKEGTGFVISNMRRL
uniref:Uncharacterized protein n=1 Tax=Stegastes partitus TaxID=144197 RepID=A0A3B5ACI7_9TELE